MAGRILLIEALSSHRILLMTALKRARYTVTAAATGRAARLEVAANAPDLVILGAVPDDTGDLADALSLTTDAGETPLLILDNDPSPAKRLAALQGGARDLLPRPVSETVLLAHVRRQMREGEILRERALRRQAAMGFGMAENPAEFLHYRSVAFVAFSDERPTALRAPLPSVSVISPDDALDIRDPGEAPAAYILDASGVHRDAALALLPELRARTHSRHAALLVIHADGDDDGIVAALNIGAGDLMPADGTAAELGFRIAQLMRRKADQDALRRSTETSMRLAVTDPLTGLFNRRYADAYLTDAIVRARVSNRPFAVLVVDIDHFKSVNDLHGHAVGDTVLIAVAQRIRDNLRGSDMIARVGGEEFLVILTENDIDEVHPAADRLRRLVCADPILSDAGQIEATVSIGVSIGDPVDGPMDPQRLIALADDALYRAKSGGRNRVEMTVPQAQRLPDGPLFNAASRRLA